MKAAIVVHKLPFLLAFLLACVSWVTHGFLDSFVFYDLPVESPQAQWTAFEHVLNHGVKIVPLVWLFVWVGAGYFRRHVKLAESRMEAGLDLAL